MDVVVFEFIYFIVIDPNYYWRSFELFPINFQSTARSTRYALCITEPNHRHQQTLI